jgi:hypothetical protein
MLSTSLHHNRPRKPSKQIKILKFHLNFIQTQIQFKSRSVFEFSFKICCDLVQVINMKLSPNGPIYLMENFQIFIIIQDIFPDLIFFLCIGKKSKSNSKFYFLFP